MHHAQATGAPPAFTRGAPPKAVTRRINRACGGRGLHLPRFNPSMPDSQVQAGVQEALGKIAHAGNAAARYAQGHPSAALIALNFSYHQIGGMYVRFIKPPQDRRKFARLEQQLDQALARGAKFAKRAGLAGCSPS